MASSVSVRHSARHRSDRVARSLLLRSCAAGAAVGGVLFLVWGYIDRPDLSDRQQAVVEVLSFLVPALFLTGVVGSCVQRRGMRDTLGRVGSALSMLGATSGVTVGLMNLTPWYGGLLLIALSSAWLPMLLAGLVLVGIANIRSRRSGALRMLPLAMGVFGWSYYFTDTGAVLEARSFHIGLGLLFSLGWMVLGFWLGAESRRQVEQRRAGQSPRTP
jgi:hypothetical protein